VTTGIDVSRGDYGLRQDTDLVYYPVSISFVQDQFKAKLSFGYLRLRSPGVAAGQTERHSRHERCVGVPDRLGDVRHELSGLHR
jgi:hypothetical protein